MPQARGRRSIPLLKFTEEDIVQDIPREAEAVLFEIHRAGLGSNLAAGLPQVWKLLLRDGTLVMLVRGCLLLIHVSEEVDRLVLDESEAPNTIA